MLPLSIATKCGQMLLAVAVFVSLSGSIYLSGNVWVEIKSWDGNNTYEATINGQDAQIIFHFEESNPQQIIKKKEYTKNQDRDILNESEIITEFNTPPIPEAPNPGTVKIVFKDDKNKGITFIYDRNMCNSEISEIDQKYLDKVFENLDKFHERNNTIDEKLKDFYNNFIKKKK